MPSSMTGFGQASFSDSEITADVIVRSVNGKNLKIKVSLGISMPSVTEQITALCNDYLTRGSVNVTVRIDWAGAGGVAFNERIIESYALQLEKLRKRLGLAGDVRIDEIAQLPGAMVADGISNRAANHIWRKLKPVVAQALERTVRMRVSEGRKLAVDLRQSCRTVRRLLREIKTRVPDAAADYRQRLTRRVRALIEQAGAQFDPGSLTRDVIMFAERADISEELCRMKAHADHFLSALRQDGTGRKLEFIAQEMQRESNTMASKASDPAMSELIIDLRGEVSKIREQVLNLE